MAGSIAKAYVQVIPSAQGMKGNLSNLFNGQMPSAGQSAGGVYGSNMIGKIKSLIVTAGLGKLLGECLTSGADLQQSLGGVETLFKESAGTVIANAETAYKTAGMSANEYMETVTSFSASLLQSLSGDTEKAATVADMALRDMSDNANKFGSDMESIQNAYQGFAKQNYTMLDNLKLGYGGTKTEMQRLLADAQKLTGVKYDINNLSDVYTAIHVIQEEMGVAGTTALESSATISGSFSSMKAAFSDLLANLALGRDIEGPLSALTESVITFAGNLLPAIGSILQGLPAVISAALSAAIQGLNLAADNAGSIVQMGIELVGSIGNAVITALPSLAEAAVNIVTAIGSAIINTDWLQIGQDVISSIQSSLSLAATEILGTDNSLVQSVGDSILAALPDLLDSGVTIVTEIANGLMAGLPGFIECAGQLLTSLVSYALDAAPLLLSSGMELVLNLANGLIANLPTIVSSAASLISNLLSTIAGKLPDLLQQGISLVGELAAGLIQAIPDILEAGAQLIGDVLDIFAETDWLQLGKDIIDGIISGLKDAASALWEVMVDLAKGCLDKVKEVLGIKSPSRRFRQEVGRWLPPGIAEGVYDNISIVDGAMRDLSDYTVSSFETHLRMDFGDSNTSGQRSHEPSSGKSVQVVQNIYSRAQTAADLMEEALYLQERAVLIGV